MEQVLGNILSFALIVVVAFACFAIFNRTDGGY
jgi:hypothetical protein